jgi:hypothetical protein
LKRLWKRRLRCCFQACNSSNSWVRIAEYSSIVANLRYVDAGACRGTFTHWNAAPFHGEREGRFFFIKSMPSPFFGRICCQANISEFLEAAEGSEWLFRRNTSQHAQQGWG